MGTVLAFMAFWAVACLVTPKAKISKLSIKEYEETRQ